MKLIKIYTDGACSGNPGKGGWGAIFIDENNSIIKEISGYSESTTNNKMELQAVIESLKLIENDIYEKIEIFTDSAYVKNGITDWIINWKKNNWKNSKKEDVKNKELWIELDLLSNKLNINWNWVKGHSNDIFNNKVDKLARNEILKH